MSCAPSVGVPAPHVPTTKAHKSEPEAAFSKWPGVCYAILWFYDFQLGPGISASVKSANA
eukprot:3290250-Amphidinium_carterae.1